MLVERAGIWDVSWKYSSMTTGDERYQGHIRKNTFCVTDSTGVVGILMIETK